jgi:UDP:flavonoid glycosyltransferase YjiC (YdhE family)
MMPLVEAAGFAAFAAGSDAGLRPVRRPLAPVDLDKEMRGFGAGFGGRIARERARDLLPLCAAWRPHLLVCEETDFGAMVAAERLRLPCATVNIIAAGEFIRREYVAPPLDQVRAEHGLPPDPRLARPGCALFLSPFPPGYPAPAYPRPSSTQFYRMPHFGGALAKPIAQWLTGRRKRPLVYFTLGTVYAMESGDLFPRALAALRGLPVDVVVTVGRDLDPAELGAQPDNIHVTHTIPQDALLPHCDLVICHGGSGSVLGAMRHGLPVVLLPMGADQPLNGARCAELGLGLTLDPMTASLEAIRTAISTALHDGRYRAVARRMQAEIDGLPGLDHALTRLEDCA